MIISTRLLLCLCECERMTSCALIHAIVFACILFRWNTNNFFSFLFFILFHLFNNFSEKLAPNHWKFYLHVVGLYISFYGWAWQKIIFLNIFCFSYFCIAATPLQSSSMSIDSEFSLALTLISLTAHEVSNWSASFWQSKSGTGVEQRSSFLKLE